MIENFESNNDYIVDKSHNLTIIDSNLDKYQDLAQGINDSELLILDNSRNGIEQITEYLTNQSNIESIHIFSHGDKAQLQLGNTIFESDDLEKYTEAIQSWNNALTDNADILIYSCNLASGSDGVTFINQFSQMAGADVAASNDLTGYDGDWDLEVAQGMIEAESILDWVSQDQYQQNLAIVEFTDFSSISGLQLNGDASQSGTALQLTPDLRSSAGSAYYATPIAFDENTSFQTQFQFQVTGGTDGADGFVFVLQNSPAGANALGGAGGKLGYRGVAQSLAIEFDTFKNSWDPDANHIDVLLNGDVTSSVTTTSSIDDLNNGDLVDVLVNYDGSTNELTISTAIDGQPPSQVLSYGVDLPSVLGSQGFVGFSSGTGGRSNAHNITNWTFSSTDNTPSPGITLTQTAGTTDVTEGGVTDIYTLVLDTQPTADVTITATSGSETTTDVPTVTFTTANWDTPQTIVVTAVDDSAVEGVHNDTIEHTVTSTDSLYDGLSLASVSVNITDNESSDPSINFTDFSSTSGLQLNGDASQSGTVLQLTPDLRSSAGSAYYATPIAFDENTSFQTQFQFQVTGGTDGADGFVFVLQNSPDGANALGGAGGNLGYRGVAQSLAIEFDTYKNSWDPDANHIDVLLNGDVTSSVATTSSIDDLNNGDLVNVLVNYDGGTNELTVSTAIDGQPLSQVLSYGVDLPSVLGSQAFVGFSSGTGGRSNAHNLTSWTFVTDSNSISRFSLKDSKTIFVSESAGVATVTVVRTGDTQEQETLEYTVNELGNGGPTEATADLDYTNPNYNGAANTGQVVFGVGETEASFNIPIVNDLDSEDFESFAVGIQNPSAGTLGTPRTLLITIVDDEGPTTLSVNEVTLAAAEKTPTTNITVLRSGNVNEEVSVDFSTSNGTAIAGEDYTTTSGVLNFGAGEITQTITIPIIDDAETEPSQSFSLMLTNPSAGVALGSSTSTITILDNDNADLGVLTRATAISGLNQPTTLDWTPDGRYMVIAQKNGVVRVVDNGTLLSTPLIDLSSEVNDTRDRGLLGLAVHPNFPTTPYVYLSYTYDPPETQGRSNLAAPDSNGNRVSRLVRVTVDPDTMIADSASLVVLVGTNSIWEYISRPGGNSTGNISIPASGIVNGTTINLLPGDQADRGYQDNDPTNPGVQDENIRDILVVDSHTHAIGDLHFGPDGYLYLSNGDGTSYNFVDPRSVRVQDVNNLSGKVLRIDPITGEGIADNPFYDGDPDSNQSKVFYYGLRNPFRFTFDPVTELPVIGDVGWTTWEEINTGEPGSNFGWPYLEGPNQTGGYSSLQQAINFYNNGNINPGSVDSKPAVFPILPRSHGSPDNANAIMVGTFFNTNTLVFGDINSGNLYGANFDENRDVTEVSLFDNVTALVDMEMGPDGLLYGVSLYSGEILRWELA